jgi:hypothetical protein
VSPAGPAATEGPGLGSGPLCGGRVSGGQGPIPARGPGPGHGVSAQLESTRTPLALRTQRWIEREREATWPGAREVGGGKGGREGGEGRPLPGGREGGRGDPGEALVGQQLLYWSPCQWPDDGRQRAGHCRQPLPARRVLARVGRPL